ncbi:hypothetical protein DACRYDRAFT_98001 [Dacryopinax primogenitus]|uniref:NADAR domain-containing protein n=1 Tax=Dacryopinax primogenitus (strain DJM 731) TaxID=1858805 RepID=M5GH54_DACPD|nr:uncharacterized protein DACRYDRAFT_98001 [Dacryopinax primogenitus]EJU06643.1 hypothetical protein DACRYDRAFT_98001 [Dacryopinax primogenitus]
MAYTYHPHPWGPFPRPLVSPQGATLVQPAPVAPAPGPIPTGKAPSNGAYALNLALRHAPEAHALTPGPTPAPAPALASPFIQVQHPPYEHRHVRFAPPEPPVPQPAPVPVYFSPRPLTGPELQTLVPETLFRTPPKTSPQSNRCWSLASSPAFPTHPLPIHSAQSAIRVVFGDFQRTLGHEDPHPDFRLCSRHAVDWRGKGYDTAEQLFHSLKFDDNAHNAPILKLIADSANPKVESEKYRRFWRPNWELEKERIMFDIIRHKMAQHPPLEKELLATGNVELYDGDTDDNNLLGRALMAHRAEMALQWRL